MPLEDLLTTRKSLPVLKSAEDAVACLKSGDAGSIDGQKLFANQVFDWSPGYLADRFGFLVVLRCVLSQVELAQPLDRRRSGGGLPLTRRVSAPIHLSQESAGLQPKMNSVI